MIGIINYGMGNLASVKNSLDYLGIKNKIVSRPPGLKNCDKIILPGVGAFGSAMQKLDKLGFTSALRNLAKENKPILGICLGMQLLFESSSELGKHRGVGLIKGKVLPLKGVVNKNSVPHMGWNEAHVIKNSLLFFDVEPLASFYFVHSFYCQPTNSSAIIANTNYGIKFASVIKQDNIWGCQFHPEKSQTNGLKILKNFSQI